MPKPDIQKPKSLKKDKIKKTPQTRKILNKNQIFAKIKPQAQKTEKKKKTTL